MDMARSLHTPAKSKTLRRRKSTKADINVDDAEMQPEDVLEIIEGNNVDKKMMKSMAVPMDKRKSVRYGIIL